MLRECSSHTMCYVSCAMCHVSRVTSQKKVFTCIYLYFVYYIYIFLLFVDKVVELVGGGSVINGAYPVYFQIFSCNICDIKHKPSLYALKTRFDSQKLKLARCSGEVGRPVLSCHRTSNCDVWKITWNIKSDRGQWKLGGGAVMRPWSGPP